MANDLNNSSAGLGVQRLDQDPGGEPGQVNETPPNEAAAVFDEGEVREMIIACQKESEDTYSELRKVWQECWNMYISKGDYSKKESFQAKVFMPELSPAIKKGLAVIKRILLRNPMYFDLVPGLISPSNQPAVPGAPPQPVNDPYTEGQKMALKYHSDECKAVSLYISAIECGLVYGWASIKWFWERYNRTSIQPGMQTVDQTHLDPFGNPYQVQAQQPIIDRVVQGSSRLAGKVMKPEQLWTNPDRTFYIEEDIISLDEVYRMSEAEAGLFDPAAVKKLVDTDYGNTTEEVDRLKQLGLMEASNPFRKKVHLYTYWGPVFDRVSGKRTMEKSRIFLANKLHVLNPHKLDNPFWHQKPPFVEISPISLLFRKEGRSLIEGSISMQKAINDLVMMTLDGLLFKLAKLFEVDPERLLVPDQIKTVAPGKPILKRGNEPALSEVAISDVPQGSMREIEILRRGIQNDTGVTDFLMASGEMKSGTTATEVSSKTAESNAQFEDIAGTIESDLIVPSLEMQKDLILQFWDDFSDPALQELVKRYGLPLSQDVPREAKLMFMKPNLRMEVRGISSYFRKVENLNKYIQFLGFVGKIKPMIMRLEVRELMDRLIQCFDFENPDKLIIPPQLEAQIKQMEMMQNIQALMPMGMMPPPGQGGPPPGGPPAQQTGGPPKPGGARPGVHGFGRPASQATGMPQPASATGRAEMPQQPS
jgi:hypothetical protein